MTRISALSKLTLQLDHVKLIYIRTLEAEELQRRDEDGICTES
jgi:hypothetical protein